MGRYTYTPSIPFTNTNQLLQQVSWIRHGDTLLLTVGRYTYTPDTRFSALHPVLTSEWQLRIAGVQKRSLKVAF
jgi:hypothetical protein